MAFVLVMLLRWFFRFWKGKSLSSGAKGERRAAEFLRREKGYRVIARNWRNPQDRRDELDLVCRDGDVLVFVEVKARAADARVPGYYSVDARKCRAVERAIRAYLARLSEKPRTFRFDVVEIPIAPDGSHGEVLHFENVALFSKWYRP